MGSATARLGHVARRFALAATALILTGCAARYFQDAGPPPAEAPRFALEQWPHRSYWTGIIFNGEKIGFSRTEIAPAGVPGEFELSSEAVIALRFLGIEKSIRLRSRDRVASDLTLRSFDYDYHIDGSDLRLTGRVEGAALRVTIVAGGQPDEQSHALDEPIYPAAAIAFMPLHRGLAVGRVLDYLVYDGQTQQLARVAQRVAAYQRSELFDGPAYRVETVMHGLTTTTWTRGDGLPLFELGLGGVMISVLEDEAEAKRYLASASLNKQESLIEFSIARVTPPLERPREVRWMRLALDAPGVGRAAPSGDGQDCRREGDLTQCEVSAARPPSPGSTLAPELAQRALGPTFTVQSNFPALRQAAAEITQGSADDLERARRIVAWMDRNVEKKAVDSFSALDVFERRKAECQGHAWLYAALARAAGVPTRVVNGIAYSEEFKGFLFHSWNESWIEGRWLPVDATFGQVGADAARVRLVDGELMSDLLPLLEWVGRIRVRHAEVRY
jgi:hypothetical protein